MNSLIGAIYTNSNNVEKCRSVIMIKKIPLLSLMIFLCIGTLAHAADFPSNGRKLFKYKEVYKQKYIQEQRQKEALLNRLFSYIEHYKQTGKDLTDQFAPIILYVQNNTYDINLIRYVKNQWLTIMSRSRLIAIKPDILFKGLIAMGNAQLPEQRNQDVKLAMFLDGEEKRLR